MALITDPARARRLARAIASDIALYNEAAIDAAIAQDTFFAACEGRLEEGLQLYRSRVDVACDQAATFFWHAVVDVILGSKGHICSPMW